MGRAPVHPECSYSSSIYDYMARRIYPIIVWISNPLWTEISGSRLDMFLHPNLQKLVLSQLHRCQAIIQTSTALLLTGPQEEYFNYANPVYGVATICHQVRWLRRGHPSLFHIATSLLIWYEMFCLRDISYRLTWMEFINLFSMYA